MNTRLRKLEGRKGRRAGKYVFLEEDTAGVYWTGEPGAPGSQVVSAEEVARLEGDNTLVVVVLRDVKSETP